jgi:glycosyltransferase involved in cell wall biosynthesis
MIRKGWLQTWVKWLYRLSLPYHHTVIFENQDDKKWFDAAGLTRPAQSKSVKGCGVNVVDFSLPDNHTVGNKITFSFIGRLIYDKGVKEFIEAAKIVKGKYDGLQFWLVGDVDEGNPSSVRIEELMYWIRDPDIHYHGATDQVKLYYAQSDCIVLPSYPAEGLPKVLMEAMAMKRPVITTRTPGCREAVDEGINGFLVPHGDAEALALAMEKFILLDETARREMGVAAREKTLREFDEHIIVDQLYHYIFPASGN